MLVLCQKLHILLMTDKIFPVTGPLYTQLYFTQYKRRPLPRSQLSPQSGGARTALTLYAYTKQEGLAVASIARDVVV